MKDKDTPLALVRQWSKMATDCYEQLDNCRSARADGKIDWPDYCLLPINAAFTYLVYSLGLSAEDAAAGCAELVACWAWRQNKVIYSFDTDTATLLAEQANDVKANDVLPADLLMHLPYPCIYIKTPGILEQMDGFWAWIDFDTNRNAPELRIQWVFEDMEHSYPEVLHIIPGGTLADCVLDTVQTITENIRKPVDVSNPVGAARTILKAVQLILYLVAENSDIESEPPLTRIVHDSASKKVSRIVQDKASEVQVNNVGVRIGSTIRRIKAKTTSSTSANTGIGGTKRPHMRRGHWHSYWTGPRSGDRKLILKWVAPTMIHPDDGADSNVVVYPVKTEIDTPHA